jgi:signal transduction histidine kinase
MPATAAPALSRLGLVGALRQAVADEFASAFDGVAWQVEAEAEQAAQALPPLAAEVVFYAAREAMRNAARYGHGEDVARPLHLQVAVACRDGLEIRVEDDGVGFTAGSETQGERGQGLALHSTLMAVVGGWLAVESAPGAHTRVTLTLPL